MLARNAPGLVLRGFLQLRGATVLGKEPGPLAGIVCTLTCLSGPICLYFCLLLCSFVCLFWSADSAQVLLQAFHSGVTPGGLGGPYVCGVSD